jgi:ADP-heptose:LPS heptosyltransferase
MKIDTAFNINGGAGRVLCSIPALELYEQENPEDNFIIVVDYGTELFKSHPTLHKRVYDWGHKNLFTDIIEDMNYIQPEPYHVREYYTQQCSIAQAFDIAINKKGIRSLPPARVNLTKQEDESAKQTLQNIKKDRKNKKVVVFQPFGRGSDLEPDRVNLDPYGKSFSVENTVKIINKLQEKYTVIIMVEKQLDFKELGCNDVPAQIPNISLRQWAGIIKYADYFLGCDSVGQHIAHSMNKRATVVLGSTYAINVTYPDYKTFDIIDLGEGKKMYSPLRLCYDEVADLNNERLMDVDEDILDSIVNSVTKNI